MPALPRGDSTAAASWALFERGAENYEQWYATRRGRRTDRAERALLLSLLRSFAGAQTALEVGCGTGHFTAWLSGRQIRTVGLDRSPAMRTVPFAWPPRCVADHRPLEFGAPVRAAREGDHNGAA